MSQEPGTIWCVDLVFSFFGIVLSLADIQTLARMTGKDFSGPVPIIKAPTPLRMMEDDIPVPQEKQETRAIRKKSRTPGLQSGNDAEEVLGDVDDYEDND